jgi:FkbH-like protein
MLDAQMDHLRAVWNGLQSSVGCQIIQNNFELPALRVLGHLDSTAHGGAVHFVNQLNLRLAAEARQNPRLLVHDIATLAATMGLDRWYAADRWFSYKIATTPEATITLAHSLAALVGATLGRTRKCLVLDLDNTLWGGVIGDDGVDHIVLGQETARGEAYIAFQQYCRRLRERGILLAVCSKNDDAIARTGFGHGDSVLALSDFAAFRANWEPKSDNIKSIAEELNIGLDSLVFVDDNPAERALVAAQLPSVAVPDVGTEVADFPRIIDGGRYFEIVSLSAEDLRRTELYAANAQRATQAGAFANYGEYLDSLEMSAEIERFSPANLDRITQLTNKTNQFNLTTRRYTQAEIERIANDPAYIGLSGRLVDTFGDNGLVSVVIARVDGASVEIDLWLMSCRVLKRGMEEAMLDALVDCARDTLAGRLVGKYLPTPKNGMVKDHYPRLGFDAEHVGDDGSGQWSLDLTKPYAARNLHIRVTPSVRHS